jgi:hypothetical protein
MANERYLLGYTQTLKRARFVSHEPGPPPYELDGQRQRLLPQLQSLATAAEAIPAEARADGQVVAVVQLNPQALSRSAFPEALFKHTDWRLLGSRSNRVKPAGGTRAKYDEPSLTTDLFVAATPAQLKRALPLLMANDRVSPGDPITRDFCNLEAIRLMGNDDRIKPGILETLNELELVLHYDSLLDARWHDRFAAFAKSVGVELDPGLEIASRGLLFMTATATRSAVEKLARFSFLRAIRPLPEPRPLEEPQLLRSATLRARLPQDPAVDPNLTIAIFDGGLPTNHPFPKWVRAIEPPPHHDIGATVPAFQAHGIAVTSAALFGSIKPNSPAPRPFATIDHYRVLGAKTGGKKGHYRALALIDEVLSQRDYPLVSLSLGPPEPMDDDNVNPWTTLLDDHLGDGTTLACVAVGNNGESAEPTCRVMAPADSVNALGIGACDVADGEYVRTPYSAKGPGRTPGLIKPDLLHFGGTDAAPYLFAGLNGGILSTTGTSFATPGVARVASGVRAHFGQKFSPMVVKALLVHCAERDDDHEVLEVGWGRACHQLPALTECPMGCARVVYAGKLTPGAVLRAPILVPPELNGNVRIRASLCYSCHTDPNTPGDYTRAGLDITFRPDAAKFKFENGKKSTNPVSSPFFKRHDHILEDERRLLAQKWNTVMHSECGKNVASLNAPCFDLHYVAREPGLSISPNDAPEIHYALVVSLIQHKTSDLYERVLAAFPTEVSALKPLIQIEPPISL